MIVVPAGAAKRQNTSAPASVGWSGDVVLGSDAVVLVAALRRAGDERLEPRGALAGTWVQALLGSTALVEPRSEQASTWYVPASACAAAMVAMTHVAPAIRTPRRTARGHINTS